MDKEYPNAELRFSIGQKIAHRLNGGVGTVVGCNDVISPLFSMYLISFDLAPEDDDRVWIGEYNLKEA